MGMRAFIAGDSQTLSRLVLSRCSEVCDVWDVDFTILKSEQNLLEELQEAGPDIVFISAALVENQADNLIARIKGHQDLNNPIVVVCAQRVQWADIAEQLGADDFLPIPFTSQQCTALLRRLADVPLKVLLVGPDDADRAALYSRLAGEVQKVSMAKSGSEGLVMARSMIPDVILCGWELPDLSGIKFCERIKRTRETSNIPVLLLARNPDIKTFEQCFEAGAHDIILPPYDPEEIGMRVTTVVATPSIRRKEKVLVIDDSFLIRTTVTRMIRQMGMIAVSASHGIEGMDLAEREHPDIILCDMDMPAMDGIELCRKLRENEMTRSIPVILTSASIPDHAREHAGELGIADFLVKPFKRGQVQECILNLLEEK